MTAQIPKNATAPTTMPTIAPVLSPVDSDGNLVGAKVGGAVRVESIIGADTVGMVLDEDCCITGDS